MYSTARRQLLDVAMPDGVRLATSVSLPYADFHGPALLLRSPYPFLSFSEATLGLELAEVLASGYAAVRQDVRGRGGSEGEFGFLAQERADGRATLSWMTAQPWCDGRVATVGGSYMGRVQLLLGDDGTPAPVAMVPSLAGLDSRTTWWQQGVLRLSFVRTWTGNLLQAEPRVLSRPEAEEVRALAAAEDLRPLLAAALDPAQPAHRLLAPLLPTLRDEPEEHARLLTPAPRIPSLHITGWWDSAVQQTIEAWRAAHAGGERHHLIVGPWSHDGYDGELHGQRFPGGDAAAWGLGIQQLDFLGGAVFGGRDPLPAVQVYVTGGVGWREHDTWPPPTVARTLFLGAAGDLADAPPPAAAELTLASRAATPVPTLGGPSGFEALPGVPQRSGPADVAAIAAREDVLTLRSAPLEHDLELAGCPALTLAARSDVALDGLVAKLAQTAPDGTLRVLADGVAAADGDGLDAPALLRIELSPLHHRVRAGQRLVLLVAASEAPRYPLGLDADRTLRLLAGGAQPGRLELPVVA